MHGELVTIYHRAVHGFLCIYASICKKCNIRRLFLLGCNNI